MAKLNLPIRGAGIMPMTPAPHMDAQHPGDRLFRSPATVNTPTDPSQPQDPLPLPVRGRKMGAQEGETSPAHRGQRR